MHPQRLSSQPSCKRSFSPTSLWKPLRRFANCTRCRKSNGTYEDLHRTSGCSSEGSRNPDNRLTSRALGEKAGGTRVLRSGCVDSHPGGEHVLLTNRFVSSELVAIVLMELQHGLKVLLDPYARSKLPLFRKRISVGSVANNETRHRKHSNSLIQGSSTTIATSMSRGIRSRFTGRHPNIRLKWKRERSLARAKTLYVLINSYWEDLRFGIFQG